MNSEIVIESYDLISLDRSRKGDGVACFTKYFVAYSYKAKMFLNTESIFTEIYLKKSKPFIVGILYRPPEKSTLLINSMDSKPKNVTSSGTFLVTGEEIFSSKIAKNSL